MSTCRGCKGTVCSCRMQTDSSTTTVIGIGAPFNPFQARPNTPTFRYTDVATKNVNQSLLAGVTTVVSFDLNLSPNTGGNLWDGGQPTRLTFPVSGLYFIGAHAGVNSSGGAKAFHFWIAKNGVSASPLVRRTVTTGAGNNLIWGTEATLYRFTANDYMELYVQASVDCSLLGAAFAGGSFLNSFPGPYLWAQWIDE